jgi:hypothetical protein
VTYLGANLTSGDPMLYPLGNYGGPTLTMPPRLGSPAIDAVTRVSQPEYTATLASWRLGEDDAGAANGASVTTTANPYGAALVFNNSVTYSSAVSPFAAGWLDSRLGLSFLAGVYGTNRLITDLRGNTAIVDNFGIELWVKPDDTASTKCLAYNGTTTSSGWGLYQVGDQYRGLFGGVAFIGSAPAAAGVWTHLALVRETGLTTFYVNGEPSGTDTRAPNPPTGWFSVGYPLNPSFPEYFAGALDEVCVFTFEPGQFRPDGPTPSLAAVRTPNPQPNGATTSGATGASRARRRTSARSRSTRRWFDFPSITIPAHCARHSSM